MPTEMAAQIEKPEHFKYLKSFRTEQCMDFMNKRCLLHKPYTCFKWHFPNQRRRRPLRNKDSGFNYSPDIYCTEYDETEGCCPEKDACQLLHRNFGESEKRYHLRFYKTDKCIHKTGNRGFCIQNGPHCPFAHSDSDMRKPVFADGSEVGAANVYEGIRPSNWVELACEEALAKLDLKWHDKDYLLTNYKTELCPINGQQCRRALACCPYYHDKDKRRNPKDFHYRGVACPFVKVNEIWGEASDCDFGDSCTYCHTRVELQYHPDVFKRVQCGIELRNECFKGIFCPFIHKGVSAPISNDSPITNGHAAIGHPMNSPKMLNNKGSNGLEGTTTIPRKVMNVIQPEAADVATNNWMNFKSRQFNSNGANQPSYAVDKDLNMSYFSPIPSTTSDSYSLSNNTNPSFYQMAHQTQNYESESNSEYKSSSASTSDSNQQQDMTTLDRFDSLDDEFLDDQQRSSYNNLYSESYGISGRTNDPPSLSSMRNVINQHPFGAHLKAVAPPSAELEMLKRELEMTKQLNRDAIEDKIRANNERDLAIRAMTKLKEDMGNENHQVRGGGGGGVLNQVSDLEKLSFPMLQRKETQLRLDLMKLQEAMYRKANGQCVICFEHQTTGAPALPCLHRSVCNICMAMVDECPICHLSFHPMK